MCPQPAPAASCPASEKSAQLAGCGEQGLLCAYPSPCAPALDQCECFSGATPDGGTGLRFECIAAICVGPEAGPAPIDSSSPVDAADASVQPDSAPDAAADAGGDSDDANGEDAARGDATTD